MPDKTKAPRLDRDQIEKAKRPMDGPDKTREPLTGKPGLHPVGTGGAAAGAVNPMDEDRYWREHYATRPYVARDVTYDVYQPAYRYGWEAYTLYLGKRWDEVERSLAEGWSNARGTTSLDWEDARAATKDAWDRVDRSRSKR